MKKIALLLILAIAFVGCNDDDDSSTPILGCTDESSENYDPVATQDDESCTYPIQININLSQNWDGTNVTSADFGTTEFTNEHGEVLKITKLRYLISKVILHDSEGNQEEIEGYKLADLEDENSLVFTNNSEIHSGTYTRISFVYGFNEEDNIDAGYPDLNAASWNWPGMLGGGYHFMQQEGTFKDSNGDPQPYAYHNGTARVSDGVFEQNFITVDIDGLSIDGNSTIDIKMNLAEWFKNPNTWNLNELSTDLMMNYDAQKMMNENGQNVFSVDVVNQ